MPCVGFEPTIPASEPAKTVHALYRSATATGSLNIAFQNVWGQYQQIEVVLRSTCVTKAGP
jgi:hypothetical protein